MRTIVRKVRQTRADWTVRNVVDMLDKGEIILDNAVQRGYVWDKTPGRMSQFILSLIYQRPIPPIYLAQVGDVYTAIDGKQRLTTIKKFLNDEFVLEGLEEVDIDDKEVGEVQGEDINTLLFHDLEESIQNAIKDASLVFIIISEPTDDEVCEYFYYLNNGMPLNAITSTRAKAKSRKIINEIGQHQLFKDALTAKAFERYTNEDIVVKSYVMLHEKNPSLETKVIRPLMEQIDVTEEDARQLNEVFDRIVEMHDKIEDKKIAKRLLTRTHMISIVPIVWQSLQDGHSSEEMAEWFEQFFSGKKSATISSEYNSHATSGSAKKESIKVRLNELKKNYKKYFSETDQSSESEMNDETDNVAKDKQDDEDDLSYLYDDEEQLVS